MLKREEEKGKWLEKQVIPFKTVTGKGIFVQVYCQTIRDEDEEIIGLIGFLVDVTVEEQNKRLFEKLGAGIYRLDENENFVYVNSAMADIFGYESPNDLIDKNVNIIWASEKLLNEFRDLINDVGFVFDRREKISPRKGVINYVSTNVFNLENPDGSYAGREGTFKDVTKEELFRRSLEDVPMGFYRIECPFLGLTPACSCLRCEFSILSLPAISRKETRISAGL